MFGNRGGRIHRADRTLTNRRWASRQWIICVLDFKGRRRALMQPNSYTELFFLDEATAIAAGHRPSFECRRRDAERFIGLWRGDDPKRQHLRAGDLDRVLQGERVGPDRSKKTFRSTLSALPDGAMVVHEGDAWLKAGRRLIRWTISGYDRAIPADGSLDCEVLTPKTSLSILAAGYRAGVHESAAHFVDPDAVAPAGPGHQKRSRETDQ
jgi:hypothetical protein